MQITKQNKLAKYVCKLISFILVLSNWSPCLGFGTMGRSGTDGNRGSDGGKGKHITIKAQGQYAAFDLSGEDGMAGGDGLPGKSASSCHQELQVRKDLVGASGGYGGSGGSGGDGGDGGNITIYFNELVNLKRIQIVSLGGQGGSGGFGAYGGEGCACKVFSWQLPECESKPSLAMSRCSRKQFFCSDGKSGQHGLHGTKGSKGAKGTAILIPQLGSLPESKEKLSLKLREWNVQGAFLNAHRFKVHYGANQLFASGSRLSSRYLLYEGMQQQQIHLRWFANRPITEFEHVDVVLFVKENHANTKDDVGIQFSPGFKHTGKLSRELDRIYYTISEASLELNIDNVQ